MSWFGLGKSRKQNSQKQAKTILISGASRGIGFACAAHLASLGHKVYAGTRRMTPIDLPGVVQIPLDVQDEQSTVDAVKTVIDQTGRLDVLVNNAGIGLIGTEEMVSISQAQTLFDVNVFGVLRMIQAVLPEMRNHRRGHIINISSLSGFHPNPLLGMYAASKFALEGMSMSLATNISPWNISVSVVEPGPARSGFVGHALTGERIVEGNNPYNDYVQANLARWKARVEQGEDPLEIARLIEQIIDNPHPDFRYAGSVEASREAAKVFCDPSGNEQLERLRADNPMPAVAPASAPPQPVAMAPVLAGVAVAGV